MFNGVFYAFANAPRAPSTDAKAWPGLGERTFRAMVLADGTRNGAHGKMANCSFWTAAALHSRINARNQVEKVRRSTDAEPNAKNVFFCFALRSPPRRPLPENAIF